MREHGLEGEDGAAADSGGRAFCVEGQNLVGGALTTKRRKEGLFAPPVYIHGNEDIPTTGHAHLS